MVLDDTRQGRGARDRRDPPWQLRVPDKGMTTDKHAVALSEADKGISTVEVEVVLARLNSIPLHAVFCGQLVELRLDNVCVLSIRERSRVSGSTKVFLAFCLHTGSETARGVPPAAAWSAGRGRVVCLGVLLTIVCLALRIPYISLYTLYLRLD